MQQGRLDPSADPCSIRYGGYCAFGVAVPKKKITIDPNAWNITDGELYLNYMLPPPKIAG
jgi:hypothetical protein